MATITIRLRTDEQEMLNDYLMANRKRYKSNAIREALQEKLRRVITSKFVEKTENNNQKVYVSFIDYNLIPDEIFTTNKEGKIIKSYTGTKLTRKLKEIQKRGEQI